jgi:ketosteroid isomerase-like protein
VVPPRAQLESLYDCFNRGDMQGLVENFAPDVEIREGYLAPDIATYRGHDGFWQWLAKGSEAVTGVQFTMGDVIAEDGDTVVFHMTVSGRGAASGAAFTENLVHASRWRDGKIVFHGAFASPEQALRETGLGSAP